MIVIYFLVALLLFCSIVVLNASILAKVLPVFKTGIIDKIVPLDDDWIIKIIIIASIAVVVFFMICLLLNDKVPSIFANFFTHIDSWIIFILSIFAIAFSFLISTNISYQIVEITKGRKIGIGISLGVLLLYFLVGKPIRVAISRRSQAYDTAKELNIVSRTPSILAGILKYLDGSLPAIAILTAGCFLFDMSIDKYLITIIAMTLVPMIGNIICDLNARAEAKRIEKKKQEELANMVANKVKGV